VDSVRRASCSVRSGRSDSDDLWRILRLLRFRLLDRLGLEVVRLNGLRLVRNGGSVRGELTMICSISSEAGGVGILKSRVSPLACSVAFAMGRPGATERVSGATSSVAGASVFCEMTAGPVVMTGASVDVSLSSVAGTVGWELDLDRCLAAVLAVVESERMKLDWDETENLAGIDGIAGRAADTSALLSRSTKTDLTLVACYIATKHNLLVTGLR